MDQVFSLLQNKDIQDTINSETKQNDNQNASQNASQKQLLQKQQETTNKINALLQQSAESIVCGPTCQKIKVSDQLKQKYLDAQTNVKTAPIQLEETKKNYYVFTKGQPYYSDLMEKELQLKAEKMSELLSESFNEAYSNAKTMNSYYDSSLISSQYTKELLNGYVEKNQALKLALRGKRGEILTNDRKTYYETTALSNLQLWYRFWWYIYYILFVVIGISIFISPGYSLKEILIKLIKLVVFIFLPYILYWGLGMLYTLYKKVKESIPINVYNNL
jgi:hypothetical protein